MRAETPVILVDAHGETTSEKIAIGRFLDGRVSAVIGTHTHMQTADEQIFRAARHLSAMPECAGAVHSILGRAIEPIVGAFYFESSRDFPGRAG